MHFQILQGAFKADWKSVQKLDTFLRSKSNWVSFYWLRWALELGADQGDLVACCIKKEEEKQLYLCNACIQRLNTDKWKAYHLVTASRSVSSKAFSFLPSPQQQILTRIFFATDSKRNYTTDQNSLHNALYRNLPYLRGVLAFLTGLRGEGLITDFQNMPNYIFTGGINNSRFITRHEMTVFFWRLKIQGWRSVKVQTLNKGSWTFRGQHFSHMKNTAETHSFTWVTCRPMEISHLAIPQTKRERHKKTWFVHLLWLFLWSLQLAFQEAPRRLESTTYPQSPGFCTGPSWTSSIPLLGIWGLQHSHERGGKRGLACVLLNATWHQVIRKHKSACPLPDLP